MSVIQGLDIGLAVLVLAVAGWTIVAREAFASVVGYVAYGLLLSLVWVRLFAVDVALTEAAIGSGVTGVLLISAAVRLRRTEAPAMAERPGVVLRIAAGALAAVVAAALAAVVLLLPDPGATLAPDAGRHLDELGVGNPITAVLIAYRSFDTMLEKVVLILAAIGVWSLAPDRHWGGAAGPRRIARPEGALAFLAQLLPPLGIVVAIHIVWVGANEPGGAFQGGAILAAMALIVIMARLAEAPEIRQPLAAAGADRGTGGVSCDRHRGLCHTGQLPRLSRRLGQAADPVHRGVHDAVHRGHPAHAGHRSAQPAAPAMSAATLAGLTAAALVGFGLYGLLTDPHPLRKILAFNILGSGVFLMFGIIARKGAAAGFAADPVPQAMVITGIVVAFSATALAVALLLRLFQETGRVTLNPDTPAETPDAGASP